MQSTQALARDGAVNGMDVPPEMPQDREERLREANEVGVEAAGPSPAAEVAADAERRRILLETLLRKREQRDA